MIFPDVKKHIEKGDTEIPVLLDGNPIVTLLEVSDRQRKLLLAGGVLNLGKVELKN